MPAEVMDAKPKEIANQNGSERTKSRPAFVPRTDIFESKDHLLLLTDMPGVDQDSVDITLERNILTILGTVKSAAIAGYSLTYSEYSVGDFRREFTLSNEIDKEEIQASMKNGVLRLVLPKSERALPKKICIQSK
ncbi:Hsp20/alpha crystallin family protein [soil metagenome]